MRRSSSVIVSQGEQLLLRPNVHVKLCLPTKKKKEKKSALLEEGVALEWRQRRARPVVHQVGLGRAQLAGYESVTPYSVCGINTQLHTSVPWQERFGLPEINVFTELFAGWRRSDGAGQ